MNSNNLDQHQINLNEFVESKQIGIFFYLSPKAGFYYIIYRGKKKVIASEMFTVHFTSCNLSNI